MKKMKDRMSAFFERIFGIGADFLIFYGQIFQLKKFAISNIKIKQ